jgi:hypothetical protein
MSASITFSGVASLLAICDGGGGEPPTGLPPPSPAVAVSLNWVPPCTELGLLKCAPPCTELGLLKCVPPCLEPSAPASWLRSDEKGMNRSFSFRSRELNTPKPGAAAPMLP